MSISIIDRDQQQRSAALNCTQSFIVQAPAGSGKTHLLTQRYLALLITVNKPEEIVALTFTRKAASEMRQRIIAALRNGQKKEPHEEHEKITWNLARAALQHSERCQWDLLENPSRLQIQTIDALCMRVTQAMPMLACLGSKAQICDDAEQLYLQATRSLFQNTNPNDPWHDHFAALLLHLDNRYSSIEERLVAMLRNRDQWLPLLINARNQESLRELLENNLRNIVVEQIRAAHANLSDLQETLLPLARYAGHNCDNLSQLIDIQEFPKASIDHIAIYQSIAQLLLTTTFTWRKSVTKNNGFPAPSDFSNKEEKQSAKDFKDRMLQFLHTCSENEKLRATLQAVLQAPPVSYSDAQWEILNSLLTLLPLLSAQLKVEFSSQQQIDFIEVASCAIAALGDEHAPTDLAMQLDYKIQHLLIDEFQDTSITQFQLIEKITTSWCDGDGRTLFIVGDPMQSIYRFRNANVGLFIHAKEHGIGAVKLHSLTLEKNFRSDRALVNWFNTLFVDVFPSLNNESLGAISYTNAIATNERGSDTDGLQCFACNDAGDEANKIIHTIERIRSQSPEQSIAILVRSRSHLLDIIPALQNAQIPYQALEIDSLHTRYFIQDLYALTRALLHLGDRLAWLSALRAPWCALSHADLLTISEFDSNKTIWETITTVELIHQLPIATQLTLTSFINIIQQSLDRRGHQSLSDLISNCWLSLGGPASLEQSSQLADCQTFFDLLAAHDCGGDIIDYVQFERRLEKLFAKAQVQTMNFVNVMTIHKSKGLEFDHVFLPKLHGKPANDDQQLLLWSATHDRHAKPRLILAPIKSSNEQIDAIYDHCRRENSTRNHYESARVLYVAITRAKKNLYLFTQITRDDDGTISKPVSHSFADLLWQHLQPKLIINFAANEQSEQPTHLQKILYIDSCTTPQTIHDGSNNPVTPYCYENNFSNVIGTFTHQLLQMICVEGVSDWDHEKINAAKPRWKNALISLGVTPAAMAVALNTVFQAITNACNSHQGKWILSNAHHESKCELALTTIENGNAKHHVIDRTFIDSNNQRWIIDYKISEHVDDHQQYISQLERYAALFTQLGDQEIQLGLYYPLNDHFISWTYQKRDVYEYPID